MLSLTFFVQQINPWCVRSLLTFIWSLPSSQLRLRSWRRVFRGKLFFVCIEYRSMQPNCQPNMPQWFSIGPTPRQIRSLQFVCANDQYDSQSGRQRLQTGVLWRSQLLLFHEDFGDLAACVDPAVADRYRRQPYALPDHIIRIFNGHSQSLSD